MKLIPVYINGVTLYKLIQGDRIGWYKDPTGQIQHNPFGPATEWASGVGNKYWYVNGKLHREDGPAVEQTSGSERWYVNGKLHREDGPAEVTDTGARYWYFNGKLHRLDGPAIEYTDGTEYWYFNGKLHRFDGPAVTTNKGAEEWYVNGLLHRIGGPAVVKLGVCKWYVYGRLSRIGGPAVESTNPTQTRYYVASKQLTANGIAELRTQLPKLKLTYDQLVDVVGREFELV